MSIEQTDTIDFLSIDPHSGEARLSISDHLDWEHEEGEHLVLLQNKLNAYLRFVESGEMIERFPETKGRNVAIVLFCVYEPSEKAQRFIGLAKNAIREAGFELRLQLRPL